MNKVIVAIVAALIIAGGAFALTRNSNSNNSTGTTSTNTPSTTQSQPTNTTPTDNTQNPGTITYDGSGFSPQVITVKAGSTVTIKNSSSSNELQFDSDPHPAHTDDTDLNAGMVSPGKSMTFTASKKGTFGYHNHLNPSQKGTITIE